MELAYGVCAAAGVCEAGWAVRFCSRTTTATAAPTIVPATRCSAMRVDWARYRRGSQRPASSVTANAVPQGTISAPKIGGRDVPIPDGAEGGDGEIQRIGAVRGWLKLTGLARAMTK